MPRHSQYQDELASRTQKSITVMVAVSFFFAILILRLFFIQVIQAEKNIKLSKENQMQLKTIKSVRGSVYDRNGIVIARNRPSYSIGILPYKMNKKINLVGNLMKIRDKQGEPIFDSLQLVKRIKKAKYRRFDITSLKEDVSMDIVSIIEEHSMELPGILVNTEARREYPMGPSTFHVMGYMTEIPESKFDSLKDLGYHYGDKIGKKGVEKQYEGDLHGTDGMEYIEVDAHGRKMGSIEEMPRVNPIPGNDLYLSIDSRLQKVAADTFPDTLKGAVVAVDPRNGEVLVMYSSPSVDPNIFSLAISLRAKSWAQTAMDPNLPLNNRATSGTYPPGSTFKLLSGLAGIANGQIDAHRHMRRSCTGGYRLGNRIAHCWYLKGHGYLDLRDAVKVSCNVYFYQLGLIIGDSVINNYANQFGLGLYTGIDLPNERKGWLSGEKAYNERFKRRGWKWTQGLVMDLAIGQPQIVTPLQLTLMVGGMGNGNNVYKPHLLKEIRHSDGTVTKQIKSEVLHDLKIEDKHIDEIKLAMEDVIVGSGGTGRRARVPGIRVGGKSGSAENPHGDKTHGLFVACAPLEDPVIAITAVVENGGHGGTVAAPIAGAVLRYFFAETEEGKKLVEFYDKNKKKGGKR